MPGRRRGQRRQWRRGSRTAAGAISAVCADIQGRCVGSMQPELRERLGLGRAGCLNESGWSTAAATAMITAPSTAANVSRRDGLSSGPGQQFRARSARRWVRHNETRECVVVLMTPVSGVLYRASAPDRRRIDRSSSSKRRCFFTDRFFRRFFGLRTPRQSLQLGGSESRANSGPGR